MDSTFPAAFISFPRFCLLLKRQFAIAVAGGFSQALAVQQADPAAESLQKSLLLERGEQEIDAWPTTAEQGCETFLGKRKVGACGLVLHRQQPPAAPRTQAVQPVAGDRLNGIGCQSVEELPQSSLNVGADLHFCSETGCRYHRHGTADLDNSIRERTTLTYQSVDPYASLAPDYSGLHRPAGGIGGHQCNGAGVRKPHIGSGFRRCGEDVALRRMLDAA